MRIFQPKFEIKTIKNNLQLFCIVGRGWLVPFSITFFLKIQNSKAYSLSTSPPNYTSYTAPTEPNF